MFKITQLNFIIIINIAKISEMDSNIITDEILIARFKELLIVAGDDKLPIVKCLDKLAKKLIPIIDDWTIMFQLQEIIHKYLKPVIPFRPNLIWPDCASCKISLIESANYQTSINYLPGRIYLMCDKCKDGYSFCDECSSLIEFYNADNDRCHICDKFYCKSCSTKSYCWNEFNYNYNMCMINNDINGRMGQLRQVIIDYETSEIKSAG